MTAWQVILYLLSLRKWGPERKFWHIKTGLSFLFSHPPFSPSVQYVCHLDPHTPPPLSQSLTHIRMGNFRLYLFFVRWRCLSFCSTKEQENAKYFQSCHFHMEWACQIGIFHLTSWQAMRGREKKWTRRERGNEEIGSHENMLSNSSMCYLKGEFTQWKCCHHLLTFMSVQTWMT